MKTLLSWKEQGVKRYGANPYLAIFCQKLYAVLALGLAGLMGLVSLPDHNCTSQVTALSSKAYGELPLSFEPNRGQTDERVKFLSRGSSYRFSLTSTEFALSLSKSESLRDEVRMKLVGANTASQVEALDELPGKVNYLIGNDPQNWRADIPTYARVQCRDVYPGVDLVYYGNQRRLEYDFVVAPGANPNAIRLAFAGVRKLNINTEGDLVLHTRGGEIHQHKPLIYQEMNNVRRAVSGGYGLKDGQQVAFEIGAYNPNEPLIIDPVLSYSTYLGGGGDEDSFDITIDHAGNTYMTGSTDSIDFNTKNPQQRENAGGRDAFVTKLNAAGNTLIYSTYFGGSGDDDAFSIAVDSAGNAYVAGSTDSTDFSVRNPLQQENAGSRDAFVAKLNTLGNALIYSTYLGGGGDDDCHGVSVDSANEAYVAGSTDSVDFNTRNPLQRENAGGKDAFVANLNAAGNALVYSTYLGGSGDEDGFSIAVDSARNAYVTGSTDSTDFNVRNPLQPKNAGSKDALVAKLNAAGNALVYSTYLGGSGDDESHSIAVDNAGNCYLIGSTDSTDLDTKNPLQQENAGGKDAFITKLNPAGNALLYSTYLGGSGDDDGFGIAVDGAGSVYVSGSTASIDFNIMNPLQEDNAGSKDAFIAKLNAAGNALIYSTYLGGGGDDDGLGITLDSAGNLYLIGSTDSTDIHIKNPLQRDNAGGKDVFVVKIGPDLITTVSAASYQANVASEAIVAAFGTSLATTIQAATTLPLPTSLAGTTVQIRDSAGGERLAPLFFVAPTQVNYQIPPGTATGPATATISSGDGVVSTGTVQIALVAPGLFTANANGQGVAAAVALRISADGSQSYEAVASFDTAQNKFISVPIDLGPPTDQVFLILFGTGIRFHGMAVTGNIGGTDAQVIFAGPQGSFVGLDQVNIFVPRSLIGRGEVNVALTADGKAANIVQVNIK